MANRYTGIGHYTFVEHKFVALFGSYERWFHDLNLVCMYCGHKPGFENEGPHCHGRAAVIQREAVRQRRAENGL